MEMFLRQVPAARTDEQDGGLLAEPILLPLRALETDRTPVGVHQVPLAFNHVGTGGRVGVFEIRHKHAGAGVEGVDDHLAVGGPGDFCAAVPEVCRDRRDGPVRFADVLRLGKEIGQRALVDLLLADGAPFEQSDAAGIEFAVQFDEKRLRLGREDLGVVESSADGVRH